ncbi:MAG: DUF4416 family protein [Planctomycetes bacterium]|nr:DUF4416 family protein [Planctomycetota bacterium]
MMLVLVAFSRHGEALDWARRRAEATWGPILLTSPPFAFTETDYYERSMGTGLTKQFFAFERLIDAARLIEIKLETNCWESEYAASGDKPEPRPLNLDPGYLTLAKFVLASTKDHAHRVYLGRGIYAEVTLHYKHDQWQHREWTFPDYRRADYQQFLEECRRELRRQLRRRGTADNADVADEE